jgi:lactoylglutathione lyase
MRVNDIEKSIRFYTDALGLTLVRTMTSPRGAKLAFLQIPGGDAEIELTQMPPGAADPVNVQPDLMHLAFQVDNLGAFAAALARKGAPLTDGPTQIPTGETIAFIDAPEGYEVELIQLGSVKK